MPEFQAVYQMRYSFLGRSGWRSEVSRDMSLLFSDERLNRRFELFQALPLASLAAQTDPDFRLVILSSDRLPEHHRRLLAEAASDTLGAARVDILFHPPASAGRTFRRHMRSALSDAPWSLQIVLDDDDAVATDFTERARAEARVAVSLFLPGQSHVFLSWANGLTVDFTGDGRPSLWHRSVPLTNLGLTLVAETRTRFNPFMTAHKRLARRHPARVIYDPAPAYVRALHGLNDSRAHRGERPVAEEDIPRHFARFPMLKALLAADPAAKAVSGG